MENVWECGCIQIDVKWILCDECKAARECPLACACCE